MMTDINVNDKVRVVFSDKHEEEGIVRRITEQDSFNYVVEIKVYGKSTEVYCNKKDLILVPRDTL